MSQLTPGTPAPDFELPDQHGNPVRLSQLRGHPVVVYFYPKDDTTGCTIEACAFRDAAPRFEGINARILGISDDSEGSHQKFIAKYGLNFTLLSDRGGSVRKLYGVKKKFGLIPGRITFVIDSDGIVRRIFDSAVDFAGHVREALQTLEETP